VTRVESRQNGQQIATHVESACCQHEGFYKELSKGWPQRMQGEWSLNWIKVIIVRNQNQNLKQRTGHCTTS